MNQKSRIDDTIEDLVSNFMYYDRKEDDELPVGAIEAAIESKDISIDWVVERFRYWLTK